MSLLALPELRDCRRIFLLDHEVEISIGWHDYEKEEHQRVRLNVDLFVPLAATTPREDNLNEVVDYDVIRDTIARCVGDGHIHLQETLIDRVASTLLAHPQVRAVRVSSEKPDIYPDCRAVGIEVFHIKP
ncbi:MAG TPA: dihydroneopterin aldolase [Burkholderiaceae bacterium]|nr:dihydroneopterin aldolase [Burkholderiaceae bacterium]